MGRQNDILNLADHRPPQYRRAPENPIPAELADGTGPSRRPPDGQRRIARPSRAARTTKSNTGFRSAIGRGAGPRPEAVIRSKAGAPCIVGVEYRHAAPNGLRERALPPWPATGLMWISGEDGVQVFVSAAYADFDVAYGRRPWCWTGTAPTCNDLSKIARPRNPPAGHVARRVQPGGRYRADGEMRWLKSFSQPRLGGSGEFIGFISIAFDITETKDAEVKLMNGEHR